MDSKVKLAREAGALVVKLSELELGASLNGNSDQAERYFRLGQKAHLRFLRRHIAAVTEARRG